MIFQLFSFCMDIHFCIANQAVGGSRLNVARRHVVTFRGWLFLSRYASALSRARRSMRGVWRADGCVVGLLLPPWAASLDWSGDTCTWWSCRASIRRLARTHALLPQRRRRRRHLGQAFFGKLFPCGSSNRGEAVVRYASSNDIRRMLAEDVAQTMLRSAILPPPASPWSGPKKRSGIIGGGGGGSVLSKVDGFIFL